MKQDDNAFIRKNMRHCLKRSKRFRRKGNKTMCLFDVHYTRWDDETRQFVDDTMTLGVEPGTFTQMFTDLTRLYNFACSENCYDINWINSIEKI